MTEVSKFAYENGYARIMMDNKFQRILDDIKRSSKTINVLPCDDIAKQALKAKYRINGESLLAAILENTGGIVIENWIRLYGAGEVDFVTRNSLYPFNEIVVGEDILGGLFICLKNGNIGYFAPDCLEPEDMEIKFGQFVYWCLHGDTDTFYKDYRWQGWQKDTAALKNDEGVAFYPFLWAEAECPESRSRTVAPMDEIIRLEFDFLEQASENSGE